MNGLGSPGNWALVLAGGDGTRLQDLTRQIAGFPIPKQYCRILGARSLLEATLERSRLFAPPQRTIVILNRNHLPVARDQLGSLTSGNILVQPCNRDTGPGMLFALLRLQSRAPSSTVAVFPSDHYVADDEAFVDHVARAAATVCRRPDKIVLLGIRPTHPEPGYGYITPVAAGAADARRQPAVRVAAFHEKPSTEVAGALLQDGALWNSFVMVCKVRRILELLQRVAPNEVAYMRALPQEPRQLAKCYPELASWNFSSHFLARIPQHLLVLPVDGVHWSDWGTPELVESTFKWLEQVPPWKARQRSRSAA
jgi:mannose-1-phosphate guanylyltransferase